MDVVRPAFLPDPRADHDAMVDQQRAIAEAARFEDVEPVDPADYAIDHSIDVETRPIEAIDDPGPTGPTVVGIDQAFTDDAAVSVAVAIRDGRIVATATGTAPLEIPYIPGFLAFREAGAIVAALNDLAVDPDLLVLDGSGRIHFRQAGIATHVGVLYDVPAIGVAKALLCGTPDRSFDDPLPAGTRVPIRTDERVEAPPATVLGHAFQSRQFPNPARRYVNPLYVSPGHRVAPETTVALVAALSAGYKLPEPTRVADAIVDERTGTASVDYKD